MRGLFTAKVLERLEQDAAAPVSESFDLVVGTSIGGLLAIGLACGLTARAMRSAIESDCAEIFHRRWIYGAGILGARYDPVPLRTSMTKLLGAWAHRRFVDIPRPVVVIAVDEAAGTPTVFRSKAFAAYSTDETTVLDVALATSAAPTFFPPHRVGERTYVDGGLVANAPDLVAASEATRAFGVESEDLLVLAIGAAASARAGKRNGDPGILSWLVRHRLFELTIDAQARLAAAQLNDLGVAALRIEKAPRSPIKLDDAGASARATLTALGDLAFDEARASHPELLRRFMVHRAG